MMQDVYIRINGDWIIKITDVARLIEDANGNCGADCWHLYGPDGQYLAGVPTRDGLTHDFPNPERIGYEAEGGAPATGAATLSQTSAEAK